MGLSARSDLEIPQRPKSGPILRKGDMAKNWRISRPFDAVDAAVGHHLSSLRSEHRCLDRTRRPTTPASAVYSFRFGYYGKLIVRKLDGNTSELSITDPQALYADSKTPEDLAKQRHPHLWVEGANERKRQAAIERCDPEIAARQRSLKVHRAAMEEVVRRLAGDGFFVEPGQVEEGVAQGEAALEATSTGRVEPQVSKPWQKIPEGWERDAEKLWWEGSTKPEIARSFRLVPKTVENRFSALRRIYGRQVVPKLDDLRKLGIRP